MALTPLRDYLRQRSPDEQAFQKWYAKQAQKWHLAPDPDDPLHYYDWRGAFRSGAEADDDGHWPSEFKMPGHPNQFVNGMDTRTGQPDQRPSLLEGLRGPMFPMPGSRRVE